jgi:hypothetical protein
MQLAIKKASDNENWLCNVMGMYAYGSIENLLRASQRREAALKIFESVAEVKEFIANNPITCDKENVICEIICQKNEIFFVPIHEVKMAIAV